MYIYIVKKNGVSLSFNVKFFLSFLDCFSLRLDDDSIVNIHFSDIASIEIVNEKVFL